MLVELISLRVQKCCLLGVGGSIATSGHVVLANSVPHDSQSGQKMAAVVSVS